MIGSCISRDVGAKLEVYDMGSVVEFEATCKADGVWYEKVRPGTGARLAGGRWVHPVNIAGIRAAPKMYPTSL